MKKSYLIICVIWLTLIMSDLAKANIPVVWQTDLNHTARNDISGLKLTPNNDNLIIFHYTAPADGGPMPGRFEKLDASIGNVIWLKTVSISGQRIAISGWVDNNENIYFGGSWGCYTLWKYDSELATELCSYTGGSGFEYVMNAIYDDANNIYVAGYSGSGPGPSTALKLDSSCNLLWACQSQQTSGQDAYTYGLALDSNNNLLRVGLDRPNTVTNHQGRLIGHDTSNGNEFLNIPVDETNSEAFGVIADAEDNIYVGYSYNLWNPDQTYTLAERSVILKLNENGDTAWKYIFDDVGMYLPWGCIVKHTDNSFYVAFNLHKNGTVYPGIAEIDSNGNLLWKDTINKPGWEIARSSFDADGEYLYLGLNNPDDDSQTQVLCLQPLILLSPNGGESFISGTTQRIEWLNPAPADANVLLEYSTNNGQVWNDVNTVPNTGSYNWLVPQVNSNQCLVRISNAANANVFDVSDNTFVIYQCRLNSKADLDGNCKVDFIDLALFAQDWLRNGNPFDEKCTECPAGMVWVSINEPNFTGQMSKYETTNAQYCEFLNYALASGDITVSGNDAIGANGSNSGEDFVGELYYDGDGAGYTNYGATNGGAARIHYSGGVFSVDSGFENHPVTHVSWYGSTAFCNYYGYRLPTEWEWQAVADYTGSFIYGCGTDINNSIANYIGSTHPDGTTVVGSFGTYGYGMCDMAGNVWEWTSSIYGSYRVIRGGSWSSSDYHCTVSFRYDGLNPNSTSDNLGFRACR